MSDDIELPDGPLHFVSAAVADDLRAERDALAARVEELEARIARALRTIPAGICIHASCPHVIAARRILRGEDEDDGAPEAR